MKTTHDMTPAERDACLANYNPDTDPDNMRGRLITAEDCVKFTLAGNATITLVSTVSGDRYTFKVAKPQDFDEARPIWFVSVLQGSDNERDFRYIGQITRGVNPLNPTSYARGRKSWVPGHKASAAFGWYWDRVGNRMEMSPQLEVWHEGRCGRCGRKLTVPESVESGYGPECIQHV